MPRLCDWVLGLEDGESQVTIDLPIGLAAAVLLHLLGVVINEAGFGKVAWEMLFVGGSAVTETLMITFVELVGTSHCCCTLLAPRFSWYHLYELRSSSRAMCRS